MGSTLGFRLFRPHADTLLDLEPADLLTLNGVPNLAQLEPIGPQQALARPQQPGPDCRPARFRMRQPECETAAATAERDVIGATRERRPAPGGGTASFV